MPVKTIRVLLADDHAIVRVGVRAVLESVSDIEIVGEATGGREAVLLAEKLTPDVVVMDLSMGDMGGAEATAEIVAKRLPTRILVLTMHAEEEYLVPLLKSGASGYLLKSAADHDLVEAVRVVARGDLYVPPSAARVLAKGVSQVDPIQHDRAQFERLTTREQDVLRLIAAGYNAPEIGEQLFISAKTVDTYKQRINEKLGFTHRSDFVKLALKLGLISP